MVPFYRSFEILNHNIIDRVIYLSIVHFSLARIDSAIDIHRCLQWLQLFIYLSNRAFLSRAYRFGYRYIVACNGCNYSYIYLIVHFSLARIGKPN